MTNDCTQVAAEEWVSFPGGELEGKRPKVLCPACREAMTRAATTPSHLAPSHPRTSHPRTSRPLCFQCYRADLDRGRALKAAGDLETASDARFQSQLPFEPVNRGRLEMLKAERSAARSAAVLGIGQYADKRRHAQIAARHALQQIAAGLKTRQLAPAIQAQAMDAAIHAAELQLPDAWLPFVVSRSQRG
jgi:hypothetical protein